MIDTIRDSLFSHSLLNIYMICALISLLVSIYFVIIPLNKLIVEYGFSIRKKESKKKKRKIIRFLNGPEQNTRNLKKIKHYLFSELVVSLLPLLVVLGFRLYIGKPSNIEYNIVNVLLIIIFFCLWLLYNISWSVAFRNMISKYIPSMQKKWHQKINHPSYLFAMLNVTNASRSSINKLSKMEIPEYIEHDELNLKPIRKESEENEEKLELDSDAIKQNPSKIGGRVVGTITNIAIDAKKLTKAGLGLADEQINDYVSEKVTSWTDQDGRWKSSLKNIINVFMPIFVVYLFSIVW